MSASGIPEAQSLSVGQKEFPFVEYGNRDERPSLILLHGISMPPTHWGAFPGELGRHTIAIGLPAGKHAPTIPTLNAYAGSMKMAIHEVAGERYDLLGLSWGGVLAQQIAVESPKHIRRLVLAGTPPAAPVPFLGVPDMRAIAAVCSTKRSSAKVGDIYGGDFRNQQTIETLGLAELAQREINPIEHTRQLLAASFSGPLVTRSTLLRALQVYKPETMFIAGDDDPIVPHLSVKLGALMLGAEMHTVSNGGHGFLLTRPKEMAGIVNNFLDRTTKAE